MNVNKTRIGWFGLMLLAAAGSASAADYTWNGGLSGVWDTSAVNWNTTGTPWAYGQNNGTVFNTSGAVVTVSGTVYVAGGWSFYAYNDVALTGAGVITSTSTGDYNMQITRGKTLTSDTSFVMPSNSTISVYANAGTGPATFAMTGGFLGIATNTADVSGYRYLRLFANTVFNQSGGLVSAKTLWVGINQNAGPATYNLTGGLLDINAQGGEPSTIGYENSGNATTGIVTIAGANAKMIVRNGTAGAKLYFGWNLSLGRAFLNLQQGEFQANAIGPYGGIGYVTLGGTNGTMVLRPYGSDNLVLGNNPSQNMFFTLTGTNGVISSTDASGVARTTTVYVPIGEDQPGRGVTFDGLGTIVLNTNNTYSGTTWLKGGTLQANHAGSLTNTSVVLLGSATVTAGGPIKGLTVNAGPATVTAGGPINALAVNDGQVTLQATTGRDVTIGAFTRNSNTIIRFSGPASPTLGNGITLSGITNTNGIIGGYAIMNGSSWAYVNGSGMLDALPASAYTKSSVAGTDPANYANANIDVDTVQTLAGPITPNSLRMINNVALTLTGTNVIKSGGMLVGSGSPYVNSGYLTSGSADGALTIFAESGFYFGGCILIDNGSTPMTLVKAGSGTVGFNGYANYSGDTYILGGTLLFPAGSTLRGGNYSGRMVIASGATFQFSSAAANQIMRGVISGAGNVSKADSNSTLTFYGTNTYTGITTVGWTGAPGGTLIINGSGVSPLVVQNSGKVVLNGTSTGYASVNAATLQVNGVLNGVVGATNSVVTIGAAGVLNGSLVAGTNCAVTVSNLVSGSVSVLGTNFLMNGIVGGSLTIASNVLIQANGQVTNNTTMSFAKYTATIKDALGDCTRLTTGGTLTLTGATLTLSDPGANLVTRGPAGYVLMKYGSRVGVFATVISDRNTKITYDDALGEVRIQYQPRGTMVRIF
jgi:fibronectin-binding autotransporter adhesin